MLNVKFNGIEYQIKNNVNEFTILEFETICTILNDEKKTKIIKWSDIFEFLGLPIDVIDEFDSFAFIQLINEFNLLGVDKEPMLQEIVIDGYTYKSFDEEFKLTVKEMGLIESFVEKNKDKYLGELMAIVFKRTDLGRNEHFDKTHIKYKADLFRKHITADKTLPFITFLSKKLIDNVELIKEEGNGK